MRKREISMRKRMLFIVCIMIVAAFGSSLLTPATAKVTGDNCIETEHGTWCAESVLVDVEKFDGVGVGDADNDGVNDIIGVGLTGKVWMASKKNGEWVVKTLWESPGELLIAAIGDADNDGKNEVVVVGMVAGPEADTGAGQVTLIEGSGNHWTTTRLFTDTHLVHAVDIGDFDPDHTGNEIVVGSFSYNMTMLTGSGSDWQATKMFTAMHKVRTVIIADVDGDGMNEVVAASKDKNIYIVEKSGGAWVNKSIFTDVSGEARCGAGDLDGDGNLEIVAGGDGANFAVLGRTGDQWSGEVIWKDSDKIRGAWIGDVYDGNPGNEAISGGYSGNVTIHFKEGSEWEHVLVFHDSGRLHHVATADVDPDHPGLEIITAGYSNRVTVIGQYRPDFSMEMTPEGHDVVTETEVLFKVTFTSIDYYTDEIDLTVEGLPEGATVTFSSNPVVLTSAKASVTVTVSVPNAVANGKHTFTIRGMGDSINRTVTGHIEVDRTVQPSVTVEPATMKVVKGQSAAYTFRVENQGNIQDSFDIDLVSSEGLDVTPSMTRTPVLGPGESVNVGVIVKIDKDQKAKTDMLTLRATSTYDGATMDSDTATTTMKEPKDGGGPSCTGSIMVSIILVVGLVGIVMTRRKR